MGHARPVVAVTGASAGVGRAVVREFARRGFDVGLIARGKDGLAAAAREVEEEGARACVAVADVADADQLENAAARIERELGPIQVWVNNAMVSVFSPVKDLQPEEARRVTEVTYLGSVYGTMTALRRMLPRDEGVIVQVGSALGYRSIPLQALYCGAKHGLNGFLDSLRCELVHQKSRVRLTTVNLPAVNTPQFEWVKTRLPGHPQPVPPIYQPEVAARAVYWAARHRRREVTVGGSTAVIVQANKLFPGLLDCYLGRSGYDSQQTQEPVDPNRPNNLWEPVPGDHGAHGSFDERAHGSSPQLWLTTHRWALAAAGAAALLLRLARLGAAHGPGRLA